MLTKKNFKISLTFSIILLFISCLMYSGVYELNFSKKINKQVATQNQPQESYINQNSPPASNNNITEEPVFNFDLELPKRHAFFHKWEVAEFENSIDLFYPYEPFSELRFHFFKDNHLEVSLFINKFLNIPTNGTGTFNIDGVFYPIGYEISEQYKDIGTNFKIIVPNKSLIDIFNDMRAGRSLTLNLNSSRIKEKFNLQGFTAATNQIKKWFNY